MSPREKPLVLITGAAGNIGTAIVEALGSRYRVVGMDQKGKTAPCDSLAVDLTSDASLAEAFGKFRKRYGSRIASVLHLAAYFDFSGEPHPLYDKLNVEGTRHLLRALQDFEVGQFIFSGTMLVHRPCAPGERIDETTPLEPAWAYPKSKAAAEAAIREEHGAIPIVLLRLAGLYDEQTAVPTLSQQIARIYERDLKSHLYAGDVEAGQSMIHRDDLVELVRRVIGRRHELPVETVLLAGEPEALSYRELQETLGCLIHGEEDWRTLTLPKPLAKVGAWLEEKAEPLVPDDFDQGELPFIRPFMIEMADAHYALEIARARKLLGWEPTHRLAETLPHLVETLKANPLGWYRANGVTPPDWLQAAETATPDPEHLRAAHERRHREQHRANLWGPFLTIGLGSWLLTSPALLEYRSQALVWSDLVSGAVLMLLGTLSLSWRLGWARWATAGVGLWLLFAPLVFWAPTGEVYLNDTLIGALAIGFSVLVRPPPGVSPVAAMSGPTIPPGWDFSPSSWFQRLPIIVLAFIGLYVSRYLAGYQLGHLDGVWEPFFAGGADPKNGTEEIITSSVSEAWPVSDAGVGAITYVLEILTGLIGSSRRWRTMPWLVVLFGILIVPLGVVSITFIIIQPIVIGTWCTLCLIGAAAMLLQIPYSLDELVATGQFLRRRKRAGRPLLRIFFTGDTDEGRREEVDDFAQSPGRILGAILSGGVGFPWNLNLCLLLGVWLLFTRATLGSEGAMADADHLIGSLVLTVTVTAYSEVGRAIRFLNLPLGAALFVTPFLFGADWTATLASLACGAALVLLSLRRGPIQARWGTWSRLIV